MLQNLKISSKRNLNQNKIQEIGTDHLGLVWTISPVGIGIAGKMFLKYVLLEKLPEKKKKIIIFI